MKIIHLADLHLGKRVHEVSMIDDQRVMLDSVIDLCSHEQPDVVIIAGDVYDKPIPSVEEINLFESFLLALSALNVMVLIIAGNHDSGERLSFGDTFFRKEGIHIAGVFDGAIEQVVIADAHGDVVFYLLPFIDDLRPPFFSGRRNLSTEDAAMRAALCCREISSLGDTVKETEVAGNSVTVHNEACAIAHQFVTNCRHTFDSEMLKNNWRDVSPFSAFDYVDFGHLHVERRV